VLGIVAGTATIMDIEDGKTLAVNANISCDNTNGGGHSCRTFSLSKFPFITLLSDDHLQDSYL
jgi:hypothetical protein